MNLPRPHDPRKRHGIALFAGAVFASVVPTFANTPTKPPIRTAPVTFVSCPIYRDTDQGPKSGCWLADDYATGVRYDIGQGRTKPQVGRMVLVEGIPAPAPNLCGGAVLKPVHTSPLASTCPAVILPAENFPGRPFVLRLDHVLPPADVVRPLPQGPFANKRWAIEFDYRSDFLAYQYSEVILDAIARYVRASHPIEVRVEGYAATRPYVVSGMRLVEPPQLAEDRADRVARALRRLGVDRKIMRVRSSVNPRPAAIDDGLAQPSLRRVTIRVELARDRPER